MAKRKQTGKRDTKRKVELETYGKDDKKYMVVIVVIGVLIVASIFMLMLNAFSGRMVHRYDETAPDTVRVVDRPVTDETMVETTGNSSGFPFLVDEGGNINIINALIYGVGSVFIFSKIFGRRGLRLF